MKRRGMSPFYHCSRDCRHTPEIVDHIFQCKLQENLWQGLGNIHTTWGDRKRAATHLVSSIVNGITRLRKIQKMKIPHNALEPIAEELSHQDEIGRLQVQIGVK